VTGLSSAKLAVALMVNAQVSTSVLKPAKQTRNVSILGVVQVENV